jgi:hypothetical protein
VQRYLPIGSSSNHFNFTTMSCYVKSSLAISLLKKPILKQRCTTHNNACPSRLDSQMFNFASHFKPWIKFAIQNEQTRMVVDTRTQHSWKYGGKTICRPWNYWKYSIMMLIPGLSELQTVSQDSCSGGDPTKPHQMKAFLSDEKLGFVGNHVAMVEAIHSIMGWLAVASQVHSRVDSKKGAANKESNEECVRVHPCDISCHFSSCLQITVK